MLNSEDIAIGNKIRLTGGRLNDHLDNTTFEIQFITDTHIGIMALNGANPLGRRELEIPLATRNFVRSDESVQELAENWTIRTSEFGSRRLVRTNGNNTTPERPMFYETAFNGYGVSPAPKPAKKVPSLSDITLKELLTIFKYIPVRYQGSDGWYHEGKVIYKKPLMCLDKYNRPRMVSTNKGVKEVYNSISISESDVVKIINFNSFLSQCKFKVRDYIKSSKTFRFTKDKKELVGKTFDGSSIKSINLKEELKPGGDKYNSIVITNSDGRGLKFLLEEIDIIYPNVNGYNMPKNRYVRAGAKVKIVNNKLFRTIPKNTVGVVTKITEIGNKRYADVIINDELIRENVKKFKVL